MLHVLRHDHDIGIDKKQQLYIIKKMINIAIRATYYIFCCRNRNLDSPDLMQFWFLLLLLLFFVFVFFFFLIIQSQAAFVNCLYVARFTIAPSNKVSIIIISLLLFFYNKSVPLFITSANTNNVDRLLFFFYSSRRAYFKAHILRGVINNSLWQTFCQC